MIHFFMGHNFNLFALEFRDIHAGDRAPDHDAAVRRESEETHKQEARCMLGRCCVRVLRHAF